MKNKKLITYDIIIFSKMIPLSGSIMGMDLGNKRIGISISNTERTVSISYDTILRTKLSKDINIINKVVMENNIVAIIVGLPLNIYGKSGKQSQSIRRLAEEINNNIMLPLLFWDERYSTLAVEKIMLNEGKLLRNKRKLHVDKFAATWILEGAIQTLKKQLSQEMLLEIQNDMKHKQKKLEMKIIKIHFLLL